MQRLQRILSGEEQIFAESYPRLKHRAEVMTVADFLEEYKDYEPVDVDPKEVTLYGRLLGFSHSVCQAVNAKVRGFSREDNFCSATRVVFALHRHCKPVPNHPGPRELEDGRGTLASYEKTVQAVRQINRSW